MHLSILESGVVGPDLSFGLDAQSVSGPELKGEHLRNGRLVGWRPMSCASAPAAVVRFDDSERSQLLELYAQARQGLATGDDPRHKRFFWEFRIHPIGWERHQTGCEETALYGGCDQLVNFDYLRENPGGTALRGTDVWGSSGVSVRQTRPFPCSLYAGAAFDMNAAVVVPRRAADLAAIWSFLTSREYRDRLTALDPSLKVTNATLVRVSFDAKRWRSVASESYPDGLPEPWSDDPTQWLFEGRPEVATEPLQVAVARLLGYRWPEQSEADDLDGLADEDGIACLPSVLGERTADERLWELLARAFGVTWSPAKTAELLTDSGSKKKDLASWLREDFFKTHCKVFNNRPFIWHVWDGRKDGFAALVNYHSLDRATLERLIYTYLGDWIERQTAGVHEELTGAEERLAAAQHLQRRFELILEGELPYDIYVRWKSLVEQPLGWEPDLNDGVRLNVRPFVDAEVLRSRFNVKWSKDRGKNPDGSERLNHLHYTRAEKEAARKGSQQ